MSNFGISRPIDVLINAIPEFFCITNTGGLFYTGNNSQTWYISSMLFMMIPIVYLLIKNKDLFIYVLAPITSIFSFGYLKSNIDFINTDDGNSRLVRALCGLCFGVLSWLMYKKMMNIDDKRSACVLFTVIEATLYLTFFVVVFNCKNNPETIFPIFLLFPIAIAITFSGKSYISRLFKVDKLKYLGTISLYVYLNHSLAISTIRALLPDGNYWFCTICAAFLTIIMCIICYIGVKVIKLLINIIRKSRGAVIRT